MSTSINSLGNWQSIGRVTSSKDWVTFSSLIVNSEILRFKFYYDQLEWDNLAGYKSYGLIRFSVDNEIIGFSQKIYVNPDVQIRHIPIPEYLKSRNILTRQISFKKIRFYKTYLPASPNDLSWDLEVNYLENG